MKRYFSIFSLFAISLIISLVACNTSQKAEKKDTPNIKYKKWMLTSVNGLWVDSLTAKNAYVIFNNDGTLGGNTGCNSFGGNYVIADNNLMALSGVYVTERACAGNVFERPLLDAINKVNKFTVENKQLVLWNNEEKLIVFSPPAR